MSTSTFISIPLEIFLLILQHLPVSSLTTLEATSKDIQNVIFAHEDVIYRSAYSLHGFLHSNPQSLTTLEDIRAEHPQLFQGDIGGWKTACKKRFLLESSWSGDGPSSFKRHTATGERACRLKVDEKHGFIINSVCEGGLIVTDIHEPNRVLWSLGLDYMWPYSHIEYDNGYLAFSNRSRSFEIWRLATIDEHNLYPYPPSVDLAQIRAYVNADTQHATENGDTRGHFKPWALLDFTPDDRRVRASRLVYPTFAAASCETVYLFDLPSSRLAGTIKNLGSSSTAHRWISYVELSERYVFVCWSGSMYAYRRPDVPDEAGEGFKGGECVFKLNPANHFGPWSMRVDALDPENAWEGRGDAVMTRPGKVVLEEEYRLQPNIFSAVHATPDASTVVVAMDNGTCIIINDFLSVIRGEVDEGNTIVTIETGKDSSLLRYIAYDCVGDRFTVALVCTYSPMIVDAQLRRRM
ncbi:hypothetical protein BDV98DRAFT_556347 [Pterulicium gracile]|uniref:F-box domain-containing protein n=1 Tax=Pterulicium gracile TaxID=1884261 RepID=A0A5C3Q0K9_9AGAR|nr:hypothetical protein BDV98DRAFT_556347 [Pterula gracilis]